MLDVTLTIKMKDLIKITSIINLQKSYVLPGKSLTKSSRHTKLST